MGEATVVSGTFAIDHLVIQGGGADGVGEQAVDGPAAVAVEEEPPRLAMVGMGEQSPLAAAHSPPPQSLAMEG